MADYERLVRTRRADRTIRRQFGDGLRIGLRQVSMQRNAKLVADQVGGPLMYGFSAA
jgi:hypothetical protein